jgi:hypothetical protein
MNMFLQVALAVFATYVFMDEKNVLTADIAFVSMGFINILVLPFSLLPDGINNIGQVTLTIHYFKSMCNRVLIHTFMNYVVFKLKFTILSCLANAFWTLKGHYFYVALYG